MTSIITNTITEFPSNLVINYPKGYTFVPQGRSVAVSNGQIKISVTVHGKPKEPKYITVPLFEGILESNITIGDNYSDIIKQKVYFMINKKYDVPHELRRPAYIPGWNYLSPQQKKEQCLNHGYAYDPFVSNNHPRKCYEKSRVSL